MDGTQTIAFHKLFGGNQDDYASIRVREDDLGRKLGGHADMGSVIAIKKMIVAPSPENGWK